MITLKLFFKDSLCCEIEETEGNLYTGNLAYKQLYFLKELANT